MEKLLEEALFEAPGGPEAVRVDGAMVRERLGGLVADVDLSRFIL